MFQRPTEKPFVPFWLIFRTRFLSSLMCCIYHCSFTHLWNEFLVIFFFSYRSFEEQMSHSVLAMEGMWKSFIFFIPMDWMNGMNDSIPSYKKLTGISFSSIGNFFFAGARIFFQSLDAAIFLFSRVSQIPTESLVLPVISTNDRLTLGCELWVG